MTTSPKTSFLSELAAGEAIPAHKRAYFQARFRNRLYDFIVRKFFDEEGKHGLTKAELARRIDRKPEVITRLLGAPGNWTLDTVSDLLLGIGAEELELQTSSLLSRPPRNFSQAEWINVKSMAPSAAKAITQSGTSGAPVFFKVKN